MEPNEIDAAIRARSLSVSRSVRATLEAIRQTVTADPAVCRERLVNVTDAVLDLGEQANELVSCFSVLLDGTPPSAQMH